jgi:preprotein translocase subunit SecG
MGFWAYFVSILLILTAIFLVLLILVQRGRGGGLAGALGGMGGQSAFGTKAGDTFTWVTYATAGFWIFLCAVGVIVMSNSGNRLAVGGDAPAAGSKLESKQQPGDKNAPAETPAAGTTGADAKSGEAVAPTAPPEGAKTSGDGSATPATGEAAPPAGETKK